MYGLKAVPFREVSFSATCKARTSFGAYGPTKVVPGTKPTRYIRDSFLEVGFSDKWIENPQRSDVLLSLHIFGVEVCSGL
jgi:hypothetical protein